MTDYAPLIVFVYKRVDTTKECLKRVNTNILAEKTDLFIFSDGPKTSEDANSVNEVRGFLHEFVNNNNFKSVTLYESKSNKGLANSIIEGVTKIIEEYGRVIVLEDDLYATPDFLQYMNGALDYYSTKEKIWSIAGYGYKLKALNDYKESIYLAYRGSSWGWATWKDRWESIDWTASSYGHFSYYLRERTRFARGGNDLPSMLKAQMNGKIDSWAVRWCFSQSIQDKYTVYPVATKIENHGFGVGTHSLISDERKYEMFQNDEQEDKFLDLEINVSIVKEFKKLHDLSIWEKIIGKIRMEIKCWKKSKPANN